MSIDNYIWVPAGARNKKQGDTGSAWTKYKSFSAIPDNQKTPHQVFLAHQGFDEQYVFADPDDARWFWLQGYQGSLFVDQDGTTPMPYDRMALWIDDEEVDKRGYSSSVCTELSEKQQTTADAAIESDDSGLLEFD